MSEISCDLRLCMHLCVHGIINNAKIMRERSLNWASLAYEVQISLVKFVLYIQYNTYFTSELVNSLVY